MTNEPAAQPHLVVMGVSGSGKTTVGVRLAELLDRPFAEADEMHPPANVAKMTLSSRLGLTSTACGSRSTPHRTTSPPPPHDNSACSADLGDAARILTR